MTIADAARDAREARDDPLGVRHGIEAILTDNAEQNVGMLAINERLGYRPLLARRRWVKSLR